jgi:DNA-binding transcriptional regulator PaaX
MNFSDKIFYALNHLVSTAEIVFSRDGLSKKLDKLEMMDGIDNRKFNRSLKRFTERNFIKMLDQKGRIRYEMTEKGMKKILELRFKGNFLAQRKWNGLWRVVIFDIPEEKKAFREAFRRRLRFLKFFPLQKSVFVFPFDCEKEIYELAQFFNVGEYLQTFLVRSLGQKEGEVKDFFASNLGLDLK